MCFLLLLLLIEIINAYPSKQPSISFISKDQIKEVGDRTILHCLVNQMNTFPVLWFHFPFDHKLPPSQLTSGNTLLKSNPRYKIYTNTSYTSYSLEIENLKKSDSGIYQCVVVYSLKEKYSREASLNVVNPIINFITPEQTKNLGETASIECIAYTTIENPILWVHYNQTYYKNSYLSNHTDVRIDDHIEVQYDQNKSVHTLLLKNLSYEDAGTYECLLLSPIPEKIVKTTLLNIV